MRALVIVLLAFGSTAHAQERARAAEDPCAGVRCSGHGACMSEAGHPFCFCEDGYAADGLRCRRTRATGHRDRARTSIAAGTVVYVATSQANRQAAQVGERTPAHPFELSRYVERGEMWCSEFISWVYASAGVPFTGGYEGGWLLTNNRAIRRWFERRSLWVSAESPAWRRFTPRPGDYVRMHTRRGHGHSAIVRYVLGETLYTVEGNVGGRVRLRMYRNFRDDWRMDGFGILASPAERRAALDESQSPIAPVDRVMDPLVLSHAREAHAAFGGRGPAARLDPRLRPGRVPSAPERARAPARDRRPRRDVAGPARGERRLPHHGARRRAGRREPRA